MKTLTKPFLFLVTVLSLNLTSAFAENGIIASIKGNGVTDKIELKANDPLLVNIELNPGSFVNVDADWWVIARLPSGEYYSWVYPVGWKSIGRNLDKPLTAYQGPLFNLSATELVNSTARYMVDGKYTVYFGVDTKMNGKFDTDSLTYTTFEFVVPQLTETCPAPKVIIDGKCVPKPTTYPSGLWSGQTVKNTPMSFVVDETGLKVTRIDFQYPDIGLSVGCMAGLSGQAGVNVDIPIVKSQFAYTGAKNQCPMYSITSNILPSGSSYGMIQFTYDPNLCECSGSATYSWTANK